MYKPENLTHYIIGTVGVQLALVDVLKEIEIQPKKIHGYSLGAIAAFYASEAIDFEQAALAGYFINLTFTGLIEKDNDSVIFDIDKSKTGQQLLKYFKQFLPSTSRQIRKQTGGKVMSNKQKSLSEDLIEKILSPNYENIINDIEKENLVLEIGSDLTYKVRNGFFNKNNEKRDSLKGLNTKYKIISLVDIGQKEPVNSFLESIGRYFF